MTAIVAVASGCSASGANGVPASARLVVTPSHVPQSAHGGGRALLYVAEASVGDVLVYRYDDGIGIRRIGKLDGFTYPAAPCTDRAGNVYVPDEEAARVVEYAHGATSPERTIGDPKAFPIACAVDPISGKLALVNFKTYGGNANIVIFDPMSATVATYTAANLATGASVSYDDSGNLYVDGLSGRSGYELDELAKGATHLVPMRVRGPKLHVPGRLQWTEAQLLAGDQSYRGRDTSGAYRVAVNGINATVVGAIEFTGSKDVAGFCERGTGKRATIVAADMERNALLVYAFPDGTFERRIGGPFTPDGAAISQAGR